MKPLQISDQLTLEQDLNLRLVKEYFAILPSDELREQALDYVTKATALRNCVESLLENVKNQQEVIEFLTKQIEAQNALIALLSKE